MKTIKNALFIFRRDLRTFDNIGLLHAHQQAEQVHPCFIITPEQTGTHNSYRSEAALGFMRTALERLSEEITEQNGTLNLFYAPATEALTAIITANKIDAVFVNRDYTPFSKKRDAALKEICDEHQINFCSYNDLLLTEPEEIFNGQKAPYKVFTPFSKTAKKKSVPQPQSLSNPVWAAAPLQGADKTLFTKLPVLPAEKMPPTAQEALAHIKKLTSYTTERNIPASESGTTQLSVHHKFGTVSIRQSWHEIVTQLGADTSLLTQLYWRDFFTHIAFHSPSVFGQSFYHVFDRLRWSSSEKNFTAWCEGKTGFPIVDAGMRQLNSTGYMHNRVRMITASFLVKDLHIDWRRGEQYFAQQLIDYDPAVNNGSWQWAASTGCDAQPYFRIFNPWSQQKKFDPDAQYIKQWVPELASYTAAQIHRLETNNSTIKNYPKPLVDHKVEAKKTIAHYKEISANR